MDVGKVVRVNGRQPESRGLRESFWRETEDWPYVVADEGGFPGSAILSRAACKNHGRIGRQQEFQLLPRVAQFVIRAPAVIDIGKRSGRSADLAFLVEREP